MIFSVAMQLQNNDVHTMNIKALSFNHANKKIDEYCHVLAREIGSSDFYYKRCSIAGNGSSELDVNYPLVKVSNKKINGKAIVTFHDSEKFYLFPIKASK